MQLWINGLWFAVLEDQEIRLFKQQLILQLNGTGTASSSPIILVRKSDQAVQVNIQIVEYKTPVVTKVGTTPLNNNRPQPVTTPVQTPTVTTSKRPPLPTATPVLLKSTPVSSISTTSVSQKKIGNPSASEHNPNPYAKQPIQKTSSSYNITKIETPSRQIVKVVQTKKTVQIENNKASITSGIRRSTTDIDDFDEFEEVKPVSTGLIGDLNMSVSEYSALLDDDNQGYQYNNRRQSEPIKHHLKPTTKTNTPILAQLQEEKLLTKTDAYVQMGSKTYPRLQKYSIELYSGDVVKIVSMHGRLFQKHKIIQMRRAQNDYYELIFGPQSIPPSRTMKFRTEKGRFEDYLVK